MMTTESTPTRREIRISGDWGKGGPANEYAGPATVDEAGRIECAADLGEGVYGTIEAQIAEGRARWGRAAGGGAVLRVGDRGLRFLPRDTQLLHRMIELRATAGRESVGDLTALLGATDR